MAIHAVVRTHPTKYDRTLCGDVLSPGAKLFDSGDGQTYLRRPDACPACLVELKAYDWNSGWCGTCRDGEEPFFDCIRACRKHDSNAAVVCMVVHARAPTHPSRYDYTQCGWLSLKVDLFDAGDWASYQWRPDACPECKDQLSGYDWSSGWCDGCREYDGSFFIVRLCREHDDYQKAMGRATMECLIQQTRVDSFGTD